MAHSIAASDDSVMGLGMDTTLEGMECGWIPKTSVQEPKASKGQVDAFLSLTRVSEPDIHGKEFVPSDT